MSTSSRRKPSKDHYRPSATLIIAAKTNDPVDARYNYNLLLFKRTAQTAYVPDHHVFPGGVFEESADASISWLHYFHDFGISSKLEQLCLRGMQRPHPLLTTVGNLPRDISLRITAIRETFEEVGVLICRDRHTFADSHSNAQYREDFDIAYWQKAVHDDPEQFLRLCQNLNVVPDLWNIFEWAVWRSSTTASRKFDTIFYFVALENQPNLILECSEAESSLWHSPASFLHSFSQRSIWIAPILFYELSRLTHMHNWLQLFQFARNRNDKGSTVLMPVYYRCKEVLVGTLTGDSFYPTDPNEHLETIEVPFTLDEFRQRSQHLHRIIMLDMYDVSIELNIPPNDAHLSPIKEEIIINKL